MNVERMVDRRQALKRVAVGAGAAMAVSIVSSPAFADGGSVPCRPTPGTGAVIWSLDLVAANRVRMRVTPGSFATVPCPCPTPANATVQYRYSLDAASPATLEVVGTFSGTSLDVWRTTNDPTPVVRDSVSATMPSPSSFTLRWTVRWRCLGRNGLPAWRCRSFVVSVSYTSPAPAATILSQSENSPGATCDLDP